MEYTVKQTINKKSSKSTIFFVLLFLLLIFFFIQYIYPKIFRKETEPKNETNIEETTAEVLEEEPIEVKELFQDIDGQLSYIAIDTEYGTKTDLPIVIYSHGSTYSVTSNPDNQLLKDLKLYGDAFVKKGYIFAASNQHGDNWGNNLAIEDTRKLIEYLQSNFTSSKNIFLIGFSMGGLPTLNFAAKYPENIVKIALLAPTSYATSWNMERVDAIRNIPIKIWHGNKDVNVPYSMTTSLIARLKAYDKEVVLETIDGAGHWDVDTERIEDILTYFQTEE
jgi:predicted esterase